MKSITFTAKSILIEKARKKAREEKTSLNAKFNEWLNTYIDEQATPKELDAFWKRYDKIDLSGASKLNRAERNAR